MHFHGMKMKYFPFDSAYKSTAILIRMFAHDSNGNVNTSECVYRLRNCYLRIAIIQLYLQCDVTINGEKMAFNFRHCVQSLNKTGNINLILNHNGIR